SEVYRYRGERAAPSTATPLRFLWKRFSADRSVRFRIDRAHPAVQALLHGGCGHAAVLESLLSMIVATVPVAAMLQNPPKALEGAVSVHDDDAFSALIELARHAELFLMRAGRSPAEARRVVLNAEPFSQRRDIIASALVNPLESQS